MEEERGRRGVLGRVNGDINCDHDVFTTEFIGVVLSWYCVDYLLVFAVTLCFPHVDVEEFAGE